MLLLATGFRPEVTTQTINNIVTKVKMLAQEERTSTVDAKLEWYSYKRQVLTMKIITKLYQEKNITSLRNKLRQMLHVHTNKKMEEEAQDPTHSLLH